MAAFTTSRKADAPVRHGNSLALAVDIKEKFVFRVLDDHGGHLASGRVAELAGRRLIARVVRVSRDTRSGMGVAVGNVLPNQSGPSGVRKTDVWRTAFWASDCRLVVGCPAIELASGFPYAATFAVTPPFVHDGLL